MALRFHTKPTATPDDTSQDELSQRIVLDDASADAFAARLANPPPPNAKLRALFKK